MRLRAALICSLVAVSAPLAQQAPAGLRVVSAAPTGELDNLSEANEIRVIFSEPMIALGSNPEAAPAWFHIAPAVNGTFHWSGTSILVLTPEPAKPLPLATSYRVTIDRGVSGVSGHALAAPYEFSFTTPTVKLTDLLWARQTARFDAPVALFLYFNQPVRAPDILAHVIVRHAAHDVPEFSMRPLSEDGRAWLRANDPAGLARYDAKAAELRAVASSTAPVAVRIATSYDRQRFRERVPGTLVVLETVTPPAPGAWLSVSVDARMPSPAGPAVPGRVQTSQALLNAPLFVNGPNCTTDCPPSMFNPIDLSATVRTDAFSRAVTVTDVTDPVRPARVAPKAPAAAASPATDVHVQIGLESAGFDRQPGMSRWMIRIDPSLVSADGQTLGYPWIGFIQTRRDDVLTSFGDGHGVWEKASGPLLPFHARNLRVVQQWLAPVSPADLMTRLRALIVADFEARPAGAGTRRTLQVTPDAIQSYGFDLSSVLKSGTGLAWAAVAPDTPIAGAPMPKAEEGMRIPARSTIVQVTNIGLTVKDSAASTLVFATRLDNGQPEPEVKVSIVDLDNRTLWTGVTNADGVAMAPALDLRKRPKGVEDRLKYSDFRFIVIGEKNGDVAYVGSDWSEGISPWEFGINYSPRQTVDVVRGAVFSDRGVYRPGEAVHFKTILRKQSASGAALLPAGTPVYVKVTDNRDRDVDARTVSLNNWSGADWTWTVPSDGSVGDYQVAVSVDPWRPDNRGNDVTAADDDEDAGFEWLRRVQSSFVVAAYRRPDFRVDTTLSAPAPVAGAALNATVSARYLFGNAMAKRPVRWVLQREMTSGAPDAVASQGPWKDYSFGYYPQDRQIPERPASTLAALDAAGRITLTLPTSAGVDTPYRYTFSGEVEDVSRQRIAGTSELTVYPAPYVIGLRVPDYFAKTSTGTSVDVVAVDLGGPARADVSVTLALKRVQWNSVRHAEGNGFYSWESERIEVPAGTWTVRTGTAPVRQALPVPEGGFYELTAESADAEGHKTRTDTFFYGTGDGYTAWERYDHNRIELKQERDTWKPGETAHVMILSPWESATALMTIEREGVRSYKRFAVTSTQQTVDVPVTDADIPNLFVSILLVRGRTSDDVGSDGSDPGKPAFRLGYTELKIEDTSKQLNVTLKADREEYRPANKAKVSVQATDANGKGARSEVTLWAVDYGVLSLTGYGLPNLREAIYSPRPLLVSTEDSRERLISRRVLTPKGEGEGGGGGADAGAGAMRKDFRPLAFWLGSVETNGSGKATAEVTLPDSLTTYHIMAVVNDQASRFGSATAEIRVSKRLTLLPALPRFLSVGDAASIGGAVTNTGRSGGAASVTIKSLDPSVLEVGGTQRITLAPGTTEAVRFDARARSAGTARIQMTAKLGGNTDAFETTLPVEVVAPIETAAASGATTSRAVERLAVPPGAAPAAGGLTVDLASTALVGLGEGARYVQAYPFQCAEQRASRALVLMLAADVGGAFSMGRIAPEDYRDTAAAALRGLTSYQCADGAFALWPGQCKTASTYLTAYLVHVLRTAETLGLPQDRAVLERATDYLEQSVKLVAPRQVQLVPVWGASTSFGVKVLAEAGRNQDANITRLYAAADRLPIVALSYLADAMAASKERGPRYQDVVRRIANATRVERDTAHVEPRDLPALVWVWDSTVTSTAVVLEGLTRRGDAAASADMARWLLAARENGRWANTHENARALAALVSYYKAHEAVAPDFTATAALGATPVGTATFKGRSTSAQTLALPMSAVTAAIGQASAAELTVSMTGTGTAFYTARLQYVPPPSSGAADRGIKVERQFETFVENGTGVPATSYAAGDLVRVTLTVTVPTERRFVAVTDPLPAGLEPIDGAFRTTAADLAAEASVQGGDRNDGSQGFAAWWLVDGFDRVEKFDDRVQLFATKLGTGRYQFTYLTRATTAGTFTAAGTRAEEMYAPDINGRAAGATVVIK